MFILRVAEAFDRARLPYAIVGGYAVALHGAVRGTVDIDLVIRLRAADFRKTETLFLDLGLRPRLPVAASEVFQFREEYIRNRNMRAWTFVNPARPSEIVDVILTEDLAHMKTRRIAVRGGILRVASIADLIRMKRGTGRPQDEEDVRALMKLQ
ncbi:MAG TPA: hypothetical protein VFD06_09585 [Candidatus Polarisedimenticolia bacterium]|nr:hypothetical protein [Candidatus Polarisedimenticolia bacterium]